MIGDASSDFAARATQLHDLAVQIMDAQTSGDMATYAQALAKYRTTLGVLAPEQRAQVKAALADEMPDSTLLALSEFSDQFGKIMQNLPLLAIVGAGLFLLAKGRRR